MTRSTAFEGATVVTMDGRRRVLEDAFVLVEDDRIAEVRAAPPPAPRADRRIPAKGKVLMPGLINCHLHSRPARALGDGLSMETWHATYAENITRHMTQEDSRVGSLIAFAESLKSGVTGVLDMTYKPLGAGQAASQIGIRATIVPLASDHPAMADCCDRFDDNIALLRDHADMCPGRLRFWIGCDSIVETSPQMLSDMAAAAKTYDVGMHTHMSEAPYDTGYIPEHFGVRAAAYLRDRGLLGPGTVLAHCNWLEPEEIEALRVADARVAHCPTSNMRLGTGVCPVPALLRAGVTVGLGTDGMLSNYKLDMFEVMRGACLLQRIQHLDAGALTSRQALEMATLGGARALGLEDEIGSIEPGKRADLILLDFQDVRFTPWLRGRHANLEAMIVWTAGGGDVDTVLVDGRVVVENHRLQTMEERDIIQAGNQAGERIADLL